jgi:hypothetical protein
VGREMLTFFPKYCTLPTMDLLIVLKQFELTTTMGLNGQLTRRKLHPAYQFSHTQWYKTFLFQETYSILWNILVGNINGTLSMLVSHSFKAENI